MREGDASSDVLQILRAGGHRVTPQRLMILEAIQARQGHMTAEDVYERVHARYPYVNRSTVYRTLELLCKSGLITATDLGKGRAHYELLRGERHHHLICQSCGTVEELDHSLLRPLQVRLQRRYRFQADIDHFAIFGLCAKCRPKRRRRNSPSVTQ